MWLDNQQCAMHNDTYIQYYFTSYIYILYTAFQPVLDLAYAVFESIVLVLTVLYNIILIYYYIIIQWRHPEIFHRRQIVNRNIKSIQLRTNIKYSLCQALTRQYFKDYLIMDNTSYLVTRCCFFILFYFTSLVLQNNSHT
jgi:hypothetical protein